MAKPSSHLDRFLRAVYRRWVAVRAAEYVGLCVLGGCGLALLVLPILLWRGEPALPVVLTTTALAAAAGLVAGVIRRPDLMSAAGEADRQLDLADLLSTALATRDRSSADPWAAMVVATADARCRTLAANDVVLNRLGGRAWGGIGLATALVLTLGLMSANPRPTVAVATSNEPAIAPERAQPNAPDASARPPRVAQQRPHPSERHSVQTGDPDNGDVAAAARASDSARRAASASDGGGAGMATSPRESDASAPRLDPSATPSPTGAEGDHSGGGRASAAPDQVSDAAGGGSTAAARLSAAAPAWRSPSWPAAREQALAAVRDGRVPDAYRDLVREYFGEEPE